MIFTKLTMHNFKSYEHAEITFDKGISIIVGENGAGKSTIFEAISFALFKEHTADKLNDLVRNNSNEKMSLELEFSSGGNLFKIIREKAGSIKSSLFRRSKENNSFIPICAGDKEVSKEIQSILNLDKKLFLNAIYVRQGEISQLVDKSPAEKKQLIGKLLGIDSLEKSWKNLAPQITEYENNKAELKGVLNSAGDIKERYDEKVLIKEELKSKCLELESRLTELEELKNLINQDLIDMEHEKEIFENFSNNMNIQLNSKDTLTHQRKIVIKQLDQIEKSLIEIDNLEKYVDKLPIYLCFEESTKKYQQLQENLNRLDSTLELILTQNEIILQKENVFIRYSNLEEEISSLKEEKTETEKQLAVITQLNSEKEDIIKNISSLREELSKFIKATKDKLNEEGISTALLSNTYSIEDLSEIAEQQVNKIKENINSIDSIISTKNEEKAKYMHIVDEAKNTLKELQSVGSHCPICQSEITSKKRLDLNNHYNNTVSMKTNEIMTIVETVNELKSKKERLNDKLPIFEEILREIIDFNFKLKSLNDLSDKLNKIDFKITEIGVDNALLGELTLKINKCENELDSLKKDYDEYNSAVTSLKFLPDEKTIQEEKNEITELITLETNKLDKAIRLDDFLTRDINHKKLSIKIKDLKEKKEEYVRLKGFVSNKVEIYSNLISIDSELTIINNKISDIQNGLDSSSYDEKKHLELKNRFEKYESQYEEVTEELRDIKGQGKVLLPLINDLKEQIKMNNIYKQQYNNFNEYIDLLNIIRVLYSKDGIQKDLRSRFRPLIQQYAKKFFSQFNFNYSDLIIDDDYNVIVYGPEGESSLDMVSGGEKIVIALSLRLGITQALSKGNSDTILLDEPTIFLDSTRKYELINLIKGMTLLPQMIIVTHESQLENAADNLIKVEKVNGISRIA